MTPVTNPMTAITQSLFLAQDAASTGIPAIYFLAPVAAVVALVAAAAELDSGLKPALEDVFWALLNSREFLFQH